MSAQLQQAIDRANQRTASQRRQLFAKKSSDRQLLEHQTKVARVALDALHADVSKGLVTSNICRAAMRELETMIIIAERRLA